MMVESFCIGHLPPFFTPSSSFKVVCPHPLGIRDEIVISDRRFGPHIEGAALSEYSQLFGLSELIKAGDMQVETLHFFQYRKFISPWAAVNQEMPPWVSYIRPADAFSLFPAPAQLNNHKDCIIVGRPFSLGVSVAKNYSEAHVAEDFATFCAACIESTKIQPEDVKALAVATEIIFSPALCILNATVFVSLMDVLQEVWSVFSRSYHIPREGYQRRSSGYLLERLHSYLLYQMLKRNQQELVSWNRYIVNP